MRGNRLVQSAMFSCVTLESLIPSDHPLRSIRVLVDRALADMDAELSAMYRPTGRPSVAPEKLLRTQLLQVLHNIPSERRMMEQLAFNMLFRWFVGLEIDDAVWDATVFTKNRERLIHAEVSQRLLEAVLVQAGEHDLLSKEHFTVDGTLIQAWAASRSFHEKDNPPSSGKGSGHKGEVLLRDKVESSTDPQARLYKKATADKSVPSYLGHALMENRNGLVVAAEASLSSAAAEREVALTLLDRAVPAPDKRKPEHHKTYTLGADTFYQDAGFVEQLRQREIAPHVSEYVKGQLQRNALTEEERQDPRFSISQNKRKMIERVFGWSKLDRVLRQVKVRGLAKVDWLFRLTITAYNLIRMSRLIPIPAPAF